MRKFHAIALAFIATVAFAQVSLASKIEKSPAFLADIPYSWASKRISGQLWGLAQSDLDGDGSAETVLLERKKIRVGRFIDKAFDQDFTCDWSGTAQAAKIYLYDLDGDGRDEAIINAVEEGLPASLILKIEGNGCKEIVSRARLSLRMIDVPPEDTVSSWQRKLAGQGSSSQQYFIGAVYEFVLKEGKLKRSAKLNLPRGTALYDFALLPSIDGNPAVAVLKGEGHLEVRYNVSGNKWRRMWQSGEKFGGSSNLLSATQRPALDQISSEYALFDMPPLPLAWGDGPHLFAVHYDTSLKGIIGRQPYIRGSRIVEFRPDPALVYVDKMSTQRLTGDVVDYIVDYIIDREGEGGNIRLLLLMQDKSGTFETSYESTILAFDLVR